MCAVPHGHVAVALALLGIVTLVEGSIGITGSGAIWTQTLPGKLKHYLPEEMKNQSSLIYASPVEDIKEPIENLHKSINEGLFRRGGNAGGIQN